MLTDDELDQSMRAEFVNPFLQAASEVLETELGSEPTRGAIGVRKSAYTTEEVTTIIEVTGTIAGLVLYGMPEETARAIVQHLQGSPCDEFDALAQSGISELGNVITGRATSLLAEAQVDQQRLVIPLDTPLGPINIQLVLKTR